MADDKIKSPGSITKTADSSDERIAEVSNVNYTISQMQKKVNQQLTEIEGDIGNVKGIEEVQNSMTKVLSNLSSTIGTLGHGFAKIAGSTAQASTDAFKQYGKAISEDININKQNVVAMALARTSPIFGYFVSQFMKTDVFQNATEKMKANIAASIGDVTSKFKEGVGDLFRRGTGKKGAISEKAISEKAIAAKAKAAKAAVPKMQTGGYVQKAGMAYLHAAEVVVPIDKLLSRMDESIAVTKELAKISRTAQIRSLAKMSTYVETTKKFEQVGIVKGFLRAFREVQTEYQEPSDKRMLRAMLAIQDSLGATIGTWPQVWQKMLVEHPTFRILMMGSRAFTKIFGMPFKLVYSIFKSRGGYQSHLSHARNPMVAAAENIGLVYTEGMWRLDNIAIYTRATAEATRDISGAITGKKYSPIEGVPRGLWSVLGLARGLTNWATKTLFKSGGAFSKFILGTLFKQKELAEWSGNFANQIGAVLTKRIKVIPRKIHRTGIPFARGRHEVKTKDIYGTGTRFVGELSEEVQKTTKRIGALPVSEIHVARIAKQSEKYMIDNKKHQKKLLGYTSDIYDLSEDEYKITKDMNRREKRRSIFGFLGGGFGAIKSLLGGGIGGILPFLAMGAGKLFASLTGVIVGGLTKVWSKIFPVIKTGLAAFLSSPILWQAVAVAAAAQIGLAIGVTLDKLIGVSKGFKDALIRLDERARKASEIENKITVENYKKARLGSQKSLEALKLTAGISATAMERGQDVGYWGRSNILAIQTAQQSFMRKRINEYLPYGSDQISYLRKKWLTEGGYKAKNIGYDANKYGLEREASFLKYIQKEGEIISIRAGGVIMDKDTLARRGIAAAEAGVISARNELKLLGDKVVKGSKELGQEITSVVSQGTTIVSSSVQNMSSAISNTAQKTKDIFSEYEFAIIRGDSIDEDF